jgi:hypothetical protein
MRHLIIYDSKSDVYSIYAIVEGESVWVKDCKGAEEMILEAKTVSAHKSLIDKLMRYGLAFVG